MIEAEIRADVEVVEELQRLENFLHVTLVKVNRSLQLNNCKLSDAQLFLNGVTGTKEFSSCDSYEKLMQLLQEEYIDIFNISRLQGLVDCFDKAELTDLVAAYEEKRKSFLKNTTVVSFQRAVVSRVCPGLLKGKAKITIKVSRKRISDRTLEDIEELAKEGFEECYKSLVQLHAECGSIIISWVFPEVLSKTLKRLTRDNSAIFKAAGVEEVIVDGRRIYSVTIEEVRMILHACTPSRRFWIG